MQDTKSKDYNPWATLFAGKTRAWAEYSVFIMIVKGFLTVGVVLLIEAKFRQSILTLIITMLWTAVIKVSKPYSSADASDNDLVAKMNQIFLLTMGLAAVSGCKGGNASCVELCLVVGDGFILGITANVVSGLVFAYETYSMITTMKIVIQARNDRAGEFFFTEHNPASHLDERKSSRNASLIYDLHREKKFRVWHPFWDGLFEEFSDSNEDAMRKGIGDRWQAIKAQAMDAGLDRVTTWLHQKGTHSQKYSLSCSVFTRKCSRVLTFQDFGPDARVLAARQALCGTLEGIDVYCDQSCFCVDEEGNCKELIETAGSHFQRRLQSLQWIVSGHMPHSKYKATDCRRWRYIVDTRQYLYIVDMYRLGDT